MDQLVHVLSKVNEVLQATGCRLKSPTVVAIGTQSSGKSSVLENIVGRDFLPRGSGLVTRCPLELQLVNVPKQPASELRAEADRAGTSAAVLETNEWAEFGHVEGRRRFYSFDEVRAEIVRQMERLAGKNKGIVATPITLTIFSPRVPDLLIVDLPGLVKMPHGDQPPDIEQQVRDMWSNYIRQPDALILAVSPANQDIVADEAIRIALEVDPEGERTIGVLTKVDLMDPGTDAREVLAGRIIPLKRGFVPVVCRGQKDLQEGVPIDRALARERMFFERHPAYRQFAARCGTQYLTRMLSYMLIAAIKQWLPRVRTEISLMMQYAEQQLRDLGRPVDTVDTAAAGQTVLRLLTRFAANFNDMLDGRVHADASDDMLTQLLFGGARIQEHIRSRFSKAVDDWMRGFVQSAHTTLPSAEILMALRNSSGPRPTLFIPEQAFVALARRYIKTLKEQGRRFVQYIYDELRRVASQCQPAELQRFGDLRERAVEVVHDLLRRNFTPTQEMVDSMIEFELSHINTLHPDFVGAEGAMRAVQANADKELFAASLRMVRDICYMTDDEGDADGEDDDEVDDGASETSDVSDEDDAGDPDFVPGHGARGRSRSREREPAGGDQPVAPDVEWAINQLGGVVPSKRGGAAAPAGASAGGAAMEAGEQGAAVRGRSTPTARGRVPSTPAQRWIASPHTSSSGKTAASPANESIRDVTERFQPQIVSEITGHGPDDPIPAGAVRVGGKHSPFVAQPVSRYMPAAELGAGGLPHTGMTPVRGIMSAGSSPAANVSPGLALNMLPPYGAAAGFAGMGAAGLAILGAMGEYVHYEVTQLPSRPLPPVITPAHLKPTPKEKLEIRVIRYLLWSYLCIVKKTYQDMVPKVVMSMLVNRAREDIASELVHRLYATIMNPDALLKETDEVAAKRRTIADHLRVLQRAMELLTEVRDFGAAAPTAGPVPSMASPAAPVPLPHPSYGAPPPAAYGGMYAAGFPMFSAAHTSPVSPPTHAVAPPGMHPYPTMMAAPPVFPAFATPGPHQAMSHYTAVPAVSFSAPMTSLAFSSGMPSAQHAAMVPPIYAAPTSLVSNAPAPAGMAARSPPQSAVTGAAASSLDGAPSVAPPGLAAGAAAPQRQRISARGSGSSSSGSFAPGAPLPVPSMSTAAGAAAAPTDPMAGRPRSGTS